MRVKDSWFKIRALHLDTEKLRSGCNMWRCKWCSRKIRYCLYAVSLTHLYSLLCGIHFVVA